MRLRRLFTLTACVALVTVAPRLAAQDCAGFTDVPAGDAFCPNVTWLKNRAITLGCSATLYCPMEAVSRLSMAAFMNRLGDIVSPGVYSTEASGASLATNGGQQVVCITAPVPGRTHDRMVNANAALSYNVTGLVDMGVRVVRSVNGGPFTGIGVGAAPHAEAGVRNHQHVTVPAVPLVANPAESHRFGVAVSNATISVQSVAGWACHLTVVVMNAVQ